ncbi:MAG: NAD(P)H-dependent glycerol-3-phosphate dehydrogenase [Paracoccaceae bacterium]
MTDISIIGAGAFGTALAISLARDGKDVSLVARNEAHVAEMENARENKARLPGFSFPDTMHVTRNPVDLAPICLLAMPTQSLNNSLVDLAPALENRFVVACCKGVDLKTGLGSTAIIHKHCPSAIAAILSGPGFAADIVAGLPTALTLACVVEDDAAKLQTALSTSNLRLYRSTDVVGVELGGALKNVIAIAAGVAIGAGLGESARAAVMTRGYAEITRFAKTSGANPETLAGLSGFGDLVLTSTSEKSRNFSYGIALGKGDFHNSGITVEGIATAKAVTNLAKKRNIDMPVTEVVTMLIDKQLTVGEAVGLLLSRPLKKE